MRGLLVAFNNFQKKYRLFDVEHSTVILSGFSCVCHSS